MRWRVVSAAVVVLLCFAVPAHADPDGDKKRVDAELAQAGALVEGATERAQEAVRAYTAATSALPGLEAAQTAARGESAASAAVAEAAQHEATKARAAFEAASQEYLGAVARVAAEQEQVGRFVSAAYSGGGLMRLDAVLASTSPTDLADRVSYLDQITKHERQLVTQLANLRLAARLRQNVADSAAETARAAEAVAVETLAAARRAEAAAVAATAAAQAQVVRQQEALAVANSEKDASLARYAELTAESQRIEALLKGAGATEPVSYHGGYFLMPVRGAYKSSDYGWRFDPYYHVSQLHAGVDLALDGGSPIYAAADGRVLQAGWNGGYGNYTCVSHGQYEGQNIATCYAHQSWIGVADGQWVRAGQLIGRVGTTGASTGDHLHFEVRLDGSPVQPLNFLPSCLCP